MSTHNLLTQTHKITIQQSTYNDTNPTLTSRINVNAPLLIILGLFPGLEVCFKDQTGVVRSVQGRIETANIRSINTENNRSNIQSY